MWARLQATWRQIRKGEPWLVALGFLALFAFHVPLLRPVVQNGDTATYNRQVELHDFDSRIIHFGYVLVGWVFHALLPIQTDLCMNVMALVFGTAALFAVYLTGVRLGSRAAGVAGVAFLLCVRAFVRSMLLAEVDILETSLVTVSLALFLHGRARLAGALFGLSMLVTPLSATTLPLFVCTLAVVEGGAWSSIRAHAIRLFWFALCGLAIYVPWVASHFHEYVYGGRGLTMAQRLPFDLHRQAVRSWRFLTTGPWVVTALYCAGIASALTDRRLWRMGQLGIAVVLSVALTLALGDRTLDVPVQLPNAVVLSLLAGLFVGRLAALRWRRIGTLSWGLPLAALIFLAPSGYAAGQREIAGDVRLRDTYRSMVEQSQPLKLLLVGPSGFMQTRVFGRYAPAPAEAESVRDFRKGIPELKQAPATAKIWFWHKIPRSVLAPLDERYELTTLTAGGKPYQVLVPRPPAP